MENIIKIDAKIACTCNLNCHFHVNEYDDMETACKFLKEGDYQDNFLICTNSKIIEFMYSNLKKDNK